MEARRRIVGRVELSLTKLIIKKKTKKNFTLDGKLNLYIMRREFEVLFSFNMYVLKLNLITS
jgi:hypothetical protein